MPAKTQYLVSIGDKFGNLTVNLDIGTQGGASGIRYYGCLCDCGKGLTVDKYALVHQRTTSCGCKND